VGIGSSYSHGRLCYTTAMAPGRYEIIRTQTAHAGWSKLLVATIRLPDGRMIEREIEDHGAAVCALPYNPIHKSAVLVRQFRAPVAHAAGEDETLEAIAGILEESDPAQCARREAMEEARLPLTSLEHAFTAWTMPGISTERMYFYLAVYSGDARAEASGGVASEHEDTMAVEIGLTELADMADRGRLTDVKTLLLVQTMRLRKPELFSP
jgi:nudix-type nucleoside diphosphatase (YffH/AdpP family)